MKTIRTEAQAKAAKPSADGRRIDYPVDGVSGLALRVGPRSRTWRLLNRKVGLRQLGAHPEVSLSEAKAAAMQLLGDAVRIKVNRTAAASPVLHVQDRRTLRAVLDEYEERRGAAVKSWSDQRRAIELRYADRLDAPAAGLGELAVLKPVLDGRNVASKRAATYLSIVLRWAKVGEPVGMGELDDLVPEASRERVLSDSEIRAVLGASHQLPGAWPAFVLASVLLMSRRGDHAQAHASHFDLDAGIWHARIHKTRGKGVSIEPMPLSTQSMVLLAPRIKRGGYIFGPKPDAPLRNNFDRTLKALHAQSDTGGWTWHDLRRTGRTIMARAGVRPDVAERCMSHALPGGTRMAAVYDRFDYETDMRAAFQSLADAIDAIVEKKPVIRRVA